MLRRLQNFLSLAGLLLIGYRDLRASSLYDVDTWSVSKVLNNCGYANAYAEYDTDYGQLNYYLPTHCAPGTFTATLSPNVPGLTSAFAQTTALNGAESAFSYASADLGTGTAMGTISSTGAATASATADLSDWLTFSAPGAGATDFVTVYADVMFTGDIRSSAASPSDYVHTEGLALITGRGQSGSYEVDWSGATPPAASSFSAGCLSDSCIDLRVPITWQGSSAKVFLDFQNTFDCGDMDTCSENYTEKISLILPSGTTCTSASGVFPCGSATPEPGSATLAVCGLAAAIAASVASRGRHRRPQC